MFDKANGKSLRTGFLRHALMSPDAPALVMGELVRSYGELATKASVWASAIHHISSDPARIGILAQRSETSYTAALAALFAGCAMVPLNPKFPPENIAAMVDQADLQAIFVDKSGLPLLPEVERHCSAKLPPVLLPDTDSQQVPGIDSKLFDRTFVENTRPLQTFPPVTPECIAYILFTSGTTGKPKGVPVTHGNVTYFLDIMSERYGIGPNDRLSQTFDQSFDLSVFDLFMAWSNGASVYSMSPVELLAPTRFIQQNELTVWFSVPSLPAHMIRRGTLKPNSLPSLRWSLFCGEPLPLQTAELWQAAAPHSTLENLYGPTELTIACFLHRWNPQTSPALSRNGIVPIGSPYPGLAAMIVDENLRPVADGHVGELCVSGPQTTCGYWQNTEKTQERYVVLPVSAYERRRFYRTGDLVARLPQGEYVFHGRADQQLKVLGHRVELGEIEAAIRRDPNVENAIACGWPLSNGSANGVVCFVTTKNKELNESYLLKCAKDILPPYAVPSRIIAVPEMPLNVNGKIDRRALQDRLSVAAS